MVTPTTNAEASLPTATYIRRNTERPEYVLARLGQTLVIGCTIEALRIPDGLVDAYIDCPDDDGSYPGMRCEFFVLEAEGGTHLDVSFAPVCDRLFEQTQAMLKGIGESVAS